MNTDRMSMVATTVYIDGREGGGDYDSGTSYWELNTQVHHAANVEI